MVISGMTFTDFARSAIAQPVTPIPSWDARRDDTYHQASFNALVENIGHMTTVAECHAKASVRRHAATLVECYIGDLSYIVSCIANS